MPMLDGIEATRQITSDPATTTAKVLILTTFDGEREVLTLIGLGMSNDEIAAKLFVSMSTVKAHVGRLLAKLGARDRAQLVIVAYSARLVGNR
jgi:DNA-binding NarL/FixJ family response regulator